MIVLKYYTHDIDFNFATNYAIDFATNIRDNIILIIVYFQIDFATNLLTIVILTNI